MQILNTITVNEIYTLLNSLNRNDVNALDDAHPVKQELALDTNMIEDIKNKVIVLMEHNVKAK